jgi:hypothetical protein
MIKAVLLQVVMPKYFGNIWGVEIAQGVVVKCRHLIFG